MPVVGERSASSSIEYDQSADSYLVRLGEESFEFSRGEDAIRDSWNFLAFEKDAGGVLSTLNFGWRYDTAWLTNPEYVRLAQLINSESNIPNGTEAYRAVDLVFGFPSDVTAVPKAGSASFTLSLSGSRSSSASNSLLLITGEGMALVDFATGRLNFHGNTFSRSLSGSTSSAELEDSVTGIATLSSDKNGFGGTFQTSGKVSETYTGTLSGSFYGPDADEIGGTLYGTSGRYYFSLAFAGQEQADVAPSDTLGSLTGVNRLESVERVVPLPDDDPFFSEYPFSEHVIYDAEKNTYQLFSTVGGEEFGAASRTPASDTEDIVSYRTTVAHVDGKVTHDIGRFDGAIDGIELTYASFFRVIQTLTGFDDEVLSRRVSYVGFGNATPADQLPRTGSASYEGRLFGDVNDGTNLLSSLSGSAALNVNFGTQALTAILSPKAISLYGNAEDLGTFSFAGSMDHFRGYFSASRADGEGTLSGRFFGDKAQEFAATFGIHLQDRGLTLEGVAIGRQDDSP